MVCCTRSSSHTVAACCGCTNIPHPAGGAQEAGTILSVGWSAQKGYGLGRIEPMRFLDKCCWYKTFTKTATAVDRDLTAICPTSPRYAVLRPHAGSSSIHRAGSDRATLSDRLRYRQTL